MDLFESLSNEKKQKILHICIEEFAEHGYQNSSTNRIISRAQISKGSLFKYFGSKEELYFYVLDYVSEDLFSEMSSEMSIDTVLMPKDLIARLAYLARAEFEIHMKKPLYFKLFQKAQASDGTAVSQRFREKFGAGSEAIARDILADVSVDNLRYDKDSTIDAVLWLLRGFNESFSAEILDGDEVNTIQDKYMRRLETYLEMLQKGIYR